MTYEELRAKFEENTSGFLSAEARARVAEGIRRVDSLADAKIILNFLP
jgi:hypothetical protein